MKPAHIGQVHVRQITPPPGTRTSSTLGRVDHEDAFVLDVEPGHVRTVRALLKDAGQRALS